MNNHNHLIRTDHPDGVTEIKLNRAPVNALSPSFLFDFAALLDDLAADGSVRSVVLSSPFKVFSAGLDLKEAQDFSLEQQQAIVEALNVGFLALFAFPKPTVAAIGGVAIAGGLFFVLGCDLRVAGPKANLGLAEVRVGADFPVGPLEIARATLSPDMLRRLMLTGQPIRAEAAHAAGIIDVLEPETDVVIGRALQEARALAELPGIAYASIKSQIRGAAIETIKTAMKDSATDPDRGWFNAETKAAMQRMIG